MKSIINPVQLNGYSELAAALHHWSSTEQQAFQPKPILSQGTLSKEKETSLLHQCLTA